MHRMSDIVTKTACAYCGKCELRCVMCEFKDNGAIDVLVKCCSCYSADVFHVEEGGK